MTKEIEGLACIGLALFCPAAAVVAGLGCLAAEITGEAYESAIQGADEMVKRHFEGADGRQAEIAAKSTASLGKVLAPFTLGASAVWMGVQAAHVREASRQAALRALQAPQPPAPTPPPPPPTSGPPTF